MTGCFLMMSYSSSLSLLGLERISSGYRDLADIVKQTAHVDLLAFGLIQTKVQCQAFGHCRDTIAVTAVYVPGINGVDHRSHDADHQPFLSMEQIHVARMSDDHQSGDVCQTAWNVPYSQVLSVRGRDQIFGVAFFVHIFV